MDYKRLHFLWFFIPIAVVFLALWLIAPKQDYDPKPLQLEYAVTEASETSLNSPKDMGFKAADTTPQLIKTGDITNHWFRIDSSQFSSIDNPVLSISPFILTNIHLYSDKNLQRPIQSISRYDFDDKRPHSNNNRVLFLTDYKESEFIYIRIEEIRTITAKFELWEFKQFLAKDTQTNTFFSSILFAIFLMIIINSFFYLTIRDKAYLYYILYHGSMLILVLNVTGYIYDYPSFEWLADRLSKGLLFLSATSFFFAIFVRHFLNTAEVSPKLDKVISFYIYVYPIAFAATLFFPSFEQELLLPTNLLSLSGVFFYSIVMIVHLAQGSRQAVFFSLAFSTFLFVLIFRFLYVWDLVEQNFFTQYGIIIAILMETIVFSIGLADRVIQLKQQRDTAELEKAKTAFVYNLEKDFNRLVSKINDHIHQSEEEDHRQYIIDAFFKEFKEKLGVNSNAVIYQAQGVITKVFDTRHKNGYHFEIIDANVDKIANFAKQQRISKLRGKLREYLVVPVEVRSHEWCACVFELDSSFVKNKAIKAFIENYANELVRSILHAEQLSEIKSQAEIDKLTGLYNRRAIEAFITHEIDKGLSRDNPLSIAFIDFDDFKNINDQYGHQAGDACLQHFSQVFTQNIPASCQLGRFGGDEFVIVMPGYNQFKALNLINKAKNKLQPIEYEAHIIDFSISIGIASETEKVKDFKALLEQSDKALYESKDSGKNTISVA